MKNQKIFYWSLTVALAGFIFGFDTVVINGSEDLLQKLWGLSDFQHGFLVTGSALWGTVIGAIFGGIPTDKLGRKKTLFWIGILYLVSALGSAMAQDPWTFGALRFIGGLGVGASTIAAPAFISEIAPSKDRGKLVALYQFNIVFGILIAFVSNFLISKYVEVDAWRWMVGIEALPALIYSLMVLGVPRSPRWLLVNQGNRTEASKVLKMIDADADTEKAMEQILEDSKPSQSNETIFLQKYRFPLLLAFLIAFFNQFSGINAFLYYAKRIFIEAGLGEEAALLSGIGAGIVNLVFTLVGIALIDRLGRRQLLFYGSVGYIISLSLVAMAFGFGWNGIEVPIFFFLFIASHAIGQGAVIWVFISEIFPNHLRAQGNAFGCGTHWVLAAIIPSMVPLLMGSIGPTIVFAFFAFMMVLQLIWVWKMMPETKGVSLEELQAKLTNQSS